MEYIIYPLLLTTLITAIRRFHANPLGSLFNPLFYLVTFNSLYLLLPPLYIDFTLKTVNWEIKDSVIREAEILSIYFSLIFYIFYILSRDQKLALTSNKLPKEVVDWSKVVFILITIFLIFIILIYVPPIYSIRSDRGAALMLYEATINSRFKFRILTYCHMVSIFILYFNYRKLKYLIPCVGYLIVDSSHGGRTLSLIMLIFVYFIIVLHTHKTYFKYFFFLILLMTFSGVIQRTESSDFIWQLFSSGAEFSNTYLTTLYLLDNSTYSQNLIEYALVSFSKIFPGGLVDKMLGFGEWYGESLSEQIGLGYGLAGNLITESLVYGGRYLAYITPLVIGAILYLVNSFSQKKYMFGVLYTIILCCTMQVIVRQYFWGFILYPFQILMFYCIWAFPSYKIRVFK